MWDTSGILTKSRFDLGLNILILEVMNLVDLNEMHADSNNWRLGIFYYSPSDPRIVVRKRFRAMGWTLNFARPLAIPLIVFVLAAIYGVMRFSDHMAWGDTGYWLSIVFMLIGISSLMGWLSNPRRYVKRA